MSTAISATTAVFKRVNGRRVPYDRLTITFTDAAPTDTYTLTLTAELFPSLAAATGVNEFFLHQLDGKRTATAATVTPRVSHASGGALIAQCAASAEATQHETSHPCRSAPLPFSAAVGSQLTVVLAPDVTGSGTVTLGIGPEA